MPAFFQLTPAERIKLQLASGNGFLKYDYGDDSQDENGVSKLVDRLVAAGVNDIRDIHYWKGSVPFANPDYGVEWIETGFWYNAETGKELSGFGGDYADTQKPENFFDLVTIQGNEGRWDYYYFLRRSPKGEPYFVWYPIWVPTPKDTFVRDLLSFDPARQWKSIKEILKGIAPLLPVAMLAVSIIFPLAMPALQAAIGQAVLGPATAAAYPAIAQTIGNVAINTLVSGGDVESAVKRAGLSTIGAGAGSVAQTNVSALVDSDLAGVLAGAATKALVVGGDMDKAVTIALLQHTGSGDSKVIETTEVTMDANNFLTEDYSLADVDYSDANFLGTGDFGSWFGDFSVAETAFDPSGFDADLSSPELASSWDLDSVIENVSDIALAAIKINAAYQATQQPPIRASVSPTTRVNSNGTVTTIASDGSAVTTRPAPGHPLQTASKDIIINNGDGTFTRIHPDGSQMMQSYSGSSQINNAMLYGGLGLLAVIALTR